MPSGIVHETVECSFLPLFVGGAIYVNRHHFPIESHLFYLFLASYIFSVFYMSPDLDLQQCRSRGRWGPLEFIWEPYSRWFSHRGLSHSLIWGTMTRILYLGIIGGIFWLAWLAWTCGVPGLREPILYLREARRFIPEIITLFLGLFLPNLIHITLDSLL